MTKLRVRGYPNGQVTSTVRPTHRSAFSGAFLSFLVPGLGQAYAGRYVRALAFVIPPLFALAVMVALFLSYGLVDFGLWVGQTSVLGPLAIVNVVLMAYRAIAAMDAYLLLVAARPEGTPRGPRRIGRGPGKVDPFSVAGLALILVVLVSGHAIAGYWDLKLYNAAVDIHAPVVIDTATDTPGDTSIPGETVEPEPSITFLPQETPAPAATIQPWTGKDRLNILVVGADQTQHFRTDTMIVISIDPVTHQVAMFSLPRDTQGLPLQPRSRLAQLFGTNFQWHLNELWKDADKYRTLFPGGGADALKQALGYAFFGNQNAIQYYLYVDFNGFQKVIDTLGGVTVNVPAPLSDDGFPGNHGDGQHLRVYIPAGIQHMNGDQALVYARSRHNYVLGGGSSSLFNDYNRSARQQQILVALEQQANISEISAHLGDLVDALSHTIHTDIPEGPDVLGPMIQLARSVKASDIKSTVFTGVTPNLAYIRATVKAAISPGAKGQDQLQAAIGENAPIIVQNGTGTSGQDTNLTTYLQGLGLNAQASAEKPATLGGTTRLLCMNGAATQYSATLAELVSVLGLAGASSAGSAAPVQDVTQPDQPAQFVIVTGTDTPSLTAPPG